MLKTCLELFVQNDIEVPIIFLKLFCFYNELLPLSLFRQGFANIDSVI